ncbi:MAG: alpha/beta hydrolase-fold protein [Thermoguttaceae bacterium]|jgi:phospholipase/carboxylesterase
MNRSRPSLKLFDQPLIQPHLEFDAGLFHATTQDTAHALFAPLHYESGYSYPLIVWLHGPESDERQLLRIMPLVSMRNYLAVAPRGPLVDRNESAAGESATRYDWRQTDAHEQQSEQRILDCLESVSQKFNVARHRVFLAGFDTGGTMAFRVALGRPERFAGVLSLGGAFPTGRNPLANLSQARRLPVLLAVGRASQVYPEVKVCADLRLLHTAGLSTTLRLYPCGHEISPQMLGDVDRWIIDQITSGSQPAPSDPQWSREAE